MEWKYCFIAYKGKQLMTLSSWKNWKKRQNYTDLIKNTRSLLSSLNSTLQWLDSNQGPPSWCWSDFRWSLERHSQRQPVFISNYYQNRATTNIEPIPISISKPPTTRRRSSPTNRAPTHNNQKNRSVDVGDVFFQSSTVVGVLWQRRKSTFERRVGSSTCDVFIKASERCDEEKFLMYKFFSW